MLVEKDEPYNNMSVNYVNDKLTYWDFVYGIWGSIEPLPAFHCVISSTFISAKICIIQLICINKFYSCW